MLTSASSSAFPNELYRNSARRNFPFLGADSSPASPAALHTRKLNWNQYSIIGSGLYHLATMKGIIGREFCCGDWIRTSDLGMMKPLLSRLLRAAPIGPRTRALRHAIRMAMVNWWTNTEIKELHGLL